MNQERIRELDAQSKKYLSEGNYNRRPRNERETIEHSQALASAEKVFQSYGIEVRK